MKKVFCKQEKPLKGKIVSFVFLFFTIMLFVTETELLLIKLLFLLVSLFLVGYSISYEFSSGFNNYKVVSVFRIVLLKSKLDVEYPDYISVFPISSSIDNEWGAIAAIGTKERQERFAIRFFKENKHFTVYRARDYEKAIKKANEIQKVLNVEIYDATKK